MLKVKFILGIDPACDSFQVALLSVPSQKSTIVPPPFQNEEKGFYSLLAFLSEYTVSKTNTLISIENTGVYNEQLAYFLHEKGFSVTLLHPLKVSKASSDSPHKTDKEDSIKIAKYSFRYLDQLEVWNPPKEIVEAINQILCARELLVKESTALQNAFISFKKRNNPQKVVLKSFERAIALIEKEKKKLEEELEKEIKKSSKITQQHVSNLKSIPGVATLLASYFLVETEGFEKNLEHKKLNSYFGICPLKFESGSSIKKRETSRKHGPSGIRRLLHLASRSICTHKEKFKNYHRQKRAQGKDNKLIYNNVSNKIVKIMCAIVKSNCSYHDNYVSLNPIFK